MAHYTTWQSSLCEMYCMALYETHYTAIVTVREVLYGTVRQTAHANRTVLPKGTARHTLPCNRHCMKGAAWHCTAKTTLQLSRYERYCTVRHTQHRNRHCKKDAALYDTHYTAITTVRQTQHGNPRCVRQWTYTTR